MFFRAYSEIVLQNRWAISYITQIVVHAIEKHIGATFVSNLVYSNSSWINYLQSSREFFAPTSTEWPHTTHYQYYGNNTHKYALPKYNSLLVKDSNNFCRPLA